MADNGGNNETIESVNAANNSFWSRKFIIAVDPGYVLVKKNIFTRTITAVDRDVKIPDNKRLDPNNPNSYVSRYEIKVNPNCPDDSGYVDVEILQSEATVKQLKQLKEYYFHTSREIFVDIINLELRYREYVYKRLLQESTATTQEEFDKELIAAWKNRRFVDEPDLIAFLGIEDDLESLNLIRKPNKLRRRDYGKQIVSIPNKEPKRGLRICWPFQQSKLEPLVEIQLDTTKVTIEVGRKISYDLDSVIVICNGAKYEEQLQNDEYAFNKEKLHKFILEQIQKIYYNYFATRIHTVKNVDSLQTKCKKDRDLQYDLAKFGMKYGIVISNVGVKVCDSEIVLSSNDEAQGIKIKTQAEIDRMNQLQKQGINPTIAFLAGSGTRTAGNGGVGGGSLHDIIELGFAQRLLGDTAGGLFGMQQGQQQNPVAPQPAPVPTETQSGLSIDYLHRMGVCDEFGNLDFDVIDEILAERGLPEGSIALGAQDLTRDEAFKVYTKRKGPRR